MPTMVRFWSCYNLMRVVDQKLDNQLEWPVYSGIRAIHKTKLTHKTHKVIPHLQYNCIHFDNSRSRRRQALLDLSNIQTLLNLRISMAHAERLVRLYAINCSVFYFVKRLVLIEVAKLEGR